MNKIRVNIFNNYRLWANLYFSDYNLKNRSYN